MTGCLVAENAKTPNQNNNEKPESGKQTEQPLQEKEKSMSPVEKEGAGGNNTQTEMIRIERNYQKQVRKILKNKTISFEKKSDLLTRALKELRNKQLLHKQREILPPANKSEIFGGGDEQPDTKEKNPDNIPERNSIQTKEPSPASSSSLSETSSLSTTATRKSSSLSSQHSSNNDIDDEIDGIDTTHDGADTSDIDDSDDSSANNEDKNKSTKHELMENAMTESLQTISHTFKKNKETLGKKQKKILRTNTHALAHFVFKNKNITMKKNRLYLSNLRKKAVSMETTKVLACLSLSREELYRFLELQTHSGIVTKLTYLEKRMLAYILKASKLNKAQVPCKTIWNLQF